MSNISRGVRPSQDSLLSPVYSLCLAAGAAAVNEQGVLHQAIEKGLAQGVVAEEFYEALLQTYLFAGFPAALEGLATLHNVLDFHGYPNPLSHQEPYDPVVFIQRGEELCRSIYTTAYEKMRNRLGHIAPDLDQWMIIEGYGKTLSRPGLPVKTRELVIIAVLAATQWYNQLYSHVRGAAQYGATLEECEEAVSCLHELRSSAALQKALETIHTVFRRTYEE